MVDKWGSVIYSNIYLCFVFVPDTVYQEIFMGENFCGLLTDATKRWHTPKFLGEKFRDKTAKFVKVFSLKSFLLYGMFPI